MAFLFFHHKLLRYIFFALVCRLSSSDVEIISPGCHDAYDGALGQTYKCKYADGAADAFVWSHGQASWLSVLPPSLRPAVRTRPRPRAMPSLPCLPCPARPSATNAGASLPVEARRLRRKLTPAAPFPRKATTRCLHFPVGGTISGRVGAQRTRRSSCRRNFRNTARSHCLDRV